MAVRSVNTRSLPGDVITHSPTGSDVYALVKGTVQSNDKAQRKQRAAAKAETEILCQIKQLQSFRHHFSHHYTPEGAPR